ncbi:MAG: flagellar biosynthesis repressor FlbT [Bradyrhizobium sp.]|nr:MAG: flagellar biosynthesis repressor FlbT [Bradyrhizobium sp.]
MNITLRAGERLYLNGAVIRVDRKATIELLNDVTFLLENHVMQADHATTPLRQIYFAIQVMLMDPNATAAASGLSRRLIESALKAFENPTIIAGLKAISGQVERSRNFEALKALRALFPLEEKEMYPHGRPEKTSAAA